MGSVFVTQEDRTIRGFGGKEHSVPFYIQFVPGYVAEVVNSTESLRYGGEHTLNTIIALPHITDKLYKRRANAGESFRYYPLFRGITDIPSKGDPILLCTIGTVNYYLGPLNTPNNSPTWNDDPNYYPEMVFNNESVGNVSGRGAAGESLNFNKNTLFSRLTKLRKKELDFGEAVREATGDTLIEGRHGNSIRIGSRSSNPYMFFSNSRLASNSQESLQDGSLISITSNGTLQQHFSQFILSSDTLEEPNRLMGTLVSSVNNNQDVQELTYNYSKNQTLVTSDRITINSKLDDIYLSSVKDIHIGTGRHLTISTNKDLIIESRKTYLGNPNKKENEDKMQSMVFGNKLVELLKEILEAVKGAQGICSGAPIPLADNTGAPGSLMPKITSLEQKLNGIISGKHYIEPNE